MKIAMFTDTYEPQVNGVVKSIKDFSNQLRKSGHEVYIFSPESPQFSALSRFVRSMKSIPFIKYPGYRIAIPYSIFIGPIFRKIKFDVVHVHTPFSLGVAGMVLAKYHKIPLVGTFHTLMPEYVHYYIERLKRLGYVRHLTGKAMWKYCSWFYNRCDYVIAPTPEIKRLLAKKGFRKDIHIVPTGVKIRKMNNSKTSLKKKYGLNSHRVILHIGRITKEKNIIVILDALKELMKKDKKIKFVIASDGPYRSDLEDYTEKSGLSENVVFTGYISPRRLYELYQLSDVFVMASKTETQGLVLLEAAMNSVPIVVMNYPVISNFVRKNKVGLIANENNFSNTVYKALNNKSLRKKFNKNGERMLCNYDIKACSKKLLDVYSI